MVNGDSIKAHIAYLADNTLKGRFPGTPEYDMATDYVIKQFKAMNLEPAGKDETFLQEIFLRKGQIDNSRSFLKLVKQNKTQTLVENKDYVFLGDLNNPSNQINAQLIYVGYGIEAIDLGHNDYQGRNVRNKIVLIELGAPSNFPATELAVYSSYEKKFATAIKQGAIGIIFLTQEYRYNRMVSYYQEKGNVGIVSPDGKVFGSSVFGSELKFVAFINKQSVKNGLDIGEPNSNVIPSLEQIEVSAKTSTVYFDFTSPNIIGKLPGGHPTLKHEIIVHSAHLDHLGIGKPINGDSIYNGAHDNASGVSSMLEIARLYSNLSNKPKRTILFIALTAEEMGLLGSDYFTRFPIVDLDKIIANINTDMPTYIAPLLSIEPIGADHSSLENNVKKAANLMNIEVNPDHMPQNVRFIRSDQYNFIKQGVPAIHIKYGLKTKDPMSDLSSKIKEFSADVYHKPSDELNDSFDFKAAEEYVRLIFLVSFSISETIQKPIWNQNSFFKKD